MEFLPPSDAENEAVKRLKARSLNFPFTDITLLRFLRGRKFDEEKAFYASQSFVSWYRDNAVDEIQSKQYLFQKELDKKLLTFGPKDKNNRPILFHFPHRHIGGDRVVQNMYMYMIYSFTSVMLLTKPEEERIVVVSYFGQYPMKNFDYECTKQFVSILQENYPETLHMCLVVDAPAIFSSFWAFMTLWLDPVTISKVNFIKMVELPQYINLEDIPEELIAH